MTFVATVVVSSQAASGATRPRPTGCVPKGGGHTRVVSRGLVFTCSHMGTFGTAGTGRCGSTLASRTSTVSRTVGVRQGGCTNGGVVMAWGRTLFPRAAITAFITAATCGMGFHGATITTVRRAVSSLI